MTYVFGPVPSRRLGRSLGVDLVPFKTCTYDCIYCQLGLTTNKTIEPGEWVPLDDVLAEISTKLASRPDYITLSGSGEPTLYSRAGELIDGIKAMTDIPVAVLTNGSLLWRKDVRDRLMRADLVVPSLDAGDEATFRTVNRPHEGISFETMLRGLIDFRREFTGEYWLEVMILAGLTDGEAAVAALVRCAERIGADRIQLNTVTRPPAESFAASVSREKLAEIAPLFNPPAEVIADFRGVHEQAGFAASREEVLATLQRRPCTIDDIAAGLGMHRNEAIKYVEDLLAGDKIVKSHVGDMLYYQARQ